MPEYAGQRSIASLQIRAVVYRLFQETVILPPKPVGFRLTYTQLWNIFFFRFVSIRLIKYQSVHFLQSYKGFVVLIRLFPLIIFENVTEQ